MFLLFLVSLGIFSLRGRESSSSVVSASLVGFDRALRTVEFASFLLRPVLVFLSMGFLGAEIEDKLRSGDGDTEESSISNCELDGPIGTKREPGDSDLLDEGEV